MSQGLEKGEKRIVIAAAIFLLLCLTLFYFSEDIFNLAGGSKGPFIGNLSNVKQCRLKLKGSLDFVAAHDKDEVHVGDSLYCSDDAHSDVSLRMHSKLKVGEKSLVVFRSVDGLNVADLQNGNFKLEGDEKIKVSVQGQLVEVDQHKSQVQFTLDPGQKPKFNVQKGSAETSVPVEKGEIDVADIPINLEQLGKFTYHWRLYDLYDVKDSQLTKKTGVPEFVPLSVEAHWADPKKRSANIALSRLGDFTDGYVQPAGPESAELTRVYLGANFWRVSYDGRNWSAAEHFDVKGEFISTGIPEVTVSQEEFTFQPPMSTVTADVHTDTSPSGFVVEQSTDENFSGTHTRAFWTTSSHIELTFDRPGIYYFRFRAVDQDQRLTEWSQPRKIHIFPLPLRMEPLAQRKPARPPKIQERPPPPVTVAQKPAVRKPADVVQSLTAQVEPKKPNYTNDVYSSSFLSMEGFVWTLQSTQQYANGDQQSPIATGAGLRGLRWWTNSGAEGIFKSQIIPVNGAAQQTSLLDIEARYHYRFFTDFPFHWARALQISIFGGGETYRNTGQNYSPHYELLTFGTLLEFPVAVRWSAGGEFAFGEGFEGSQKYEITGHIKYYLSRKWSLGFGYLLHLFQAGSSTSAPYGILPYREGYTEGFSTLDYHF